MSQFRPIQGHIAMLVRETMSCVAVLFGPRDWGAYSCGVEEYLPEDIGERVEGAFRESKFEFIRIYSASDPSEPEVTHVFVLGKRGTIWYGLEMDGSDPARLRALLGRLSVPLMGPFSYSLPEGKVAIICAAALVMVAATACYFSVVHETATGTWQLAITIAIVATIGCGVLIYLPKCAWERRARELINALAVMKPA
jgi:uncharacterized membrane protein